jgi:putative membrane protein
LSATPPEDPEERAFDRVKAEVEKATIVRMAAAFAIAVKHYLRGEEGM